MLPRLLTLAVLLSAGLSAGLVRAEPLWDKVQNPHIAEVRRLVREAEEARATADNIYQPHQRPIAQRLRRVAADKLCRAAVLSPEDIELHLRCGRIARRAEDYAPALLAFAHAQQLDSRALTAEDHHAYAVALLALGRLDEAALAVGRGLALQRGENAVSALRPTLALIRMADGRLDEAADQLELVAAGNALSEACLHHILAVIYDRDEQVGRAAEALDRASAIDSTFAHMSGFGGCSVEPFYVGAAERHYFLALAYERQGELSAAAESWRAYLLSARPRWAGRARAHLVELAARLDAPPPREGGVIGGVVP